MSRLTFLCSIVSDGQSDVYARYGKRLIDLLIAVPILVLCLPVIGVLWLAVRVKLGSPVFFRQQRPGRHGVPFVMVKFRTMTDARDPSGNLLPDADRLPSFGKFLRSTSLDELPELWNVVRGDMSLVGPRPLLMRYYPYFTESERIRFTVRPGVTGLAQVEGRNDIGWNSRIAKDIEYVHYVSLKLDAEILFLTIHRVFTRKGLRVDPGSVMLDFDEERKRQRQNPDEGTVAT